MLRRTAFADVAAMFEMQLDEEVNRLSGTIPRGRDAFEAVWKKILETGEAGGVTPRAIEVDGRLVGMINAFPQEGKACIGYLIAREHWGRGIASEAVRLLLGEVTVRPLFARVPVHNVASQRVLQKNGFEIVERGRSEGTERYVASEVFLLRLGEPPVGDA